MNFIKINWINKTQNEQMQFASMNKKNFDYPILFHLLKAKHNHLINFLSIYKNYIF